MKILCVILIEVALSLSLFSNERNLPPSNYIGIFDNFETYENGKIPYAATTKYSGTWEWRSPSTGWFITGNYKNGLPYGTWISYTQLGLPYIIYNYNDENGFVVASYYPDGTISSHNYGKIIITNDSFSHKYGNSTKWNFLGEIIKQDSRKNVSLGWMWKYPYEGNNRSFTKNDKILSFYYTTFDDEIIQTAFYLTEGKAFLGKIVANYKLDHEKGTISFVKSFHFGMIDDSKIGLAFLPPEESEDGSRKIQIHMNVFLENEGIDADLFNIELVNRNGK